MWGYYTTLVPTVMGNVYFLLITLVQIFENPTYLFNPIAWFEFLSHFLNGLIIFDRVVYQNPVSENLHFLVAIAVWLMWYKLLQYLTIFTVFSYWYLLIM